MLALERQSRRRPAAAVSAPDDAEGPSRSSADTGNIAADGILARRESCATPGRHANAANDRPRPDTPDCNTVPDHTAGQRTLRSLLADNAAADPDKSLALKKIVDHYEVDPRERQLPKGQVPGRTSIPLRDALNPQPPPSASHPFQANRPGPGRHISAGHLLSWPATWPIPGRRLQTNHR
jgi:hypothetical protein